MVDAPRSVVEVLAPGLFLPTSAEAAPASRVPALEMLLARADRHALADNDAVEWLMRRFGVPPADDWPGGALSLLGDGGTPGDACWMRADPVYLRVNRDQVILADHRVFTISQVEAEAVCSALNRHFSAEGFVFYPLRPERWYLRVPTLPAITTTSLSTAVGRHIDPLLPKGADALAWHRIFNEAQMLLHDLRVNEERDARGELPVNSVWAWGAGSLPAQLERPFSVVMARDAMVRGLALAAHCVALDPKTDLPQCLSEGPRGTLLVYEDALEAAHAYGNDAAWNDALGKLEQEVFAPLLDALKAGRIEKLCIMSFAAGHGIRFEVTRASLWRFWRSARPLSSFA